jgi:hypothetical protein
MIGTLPWPASSPGRFRFELEQATPRQITDEPHVTPVNHAFWPFGNCCHRKLALILTVPGGDA